MQFNRDDIRGFLTEGATGLWPRAIPQNTGRCLKKPNPSYSVRPLSRFDYWPRLSVVAAVEEHEGSRFRYPKKAFSFTVITFTAIRRSAFAFCSRHKISCISHRETVTFERRVRRFARQDSLDTSLSERCKFKCNADYTMSQVDYFATIVDLNVPRRFQHPWDKHFFTLRNCRQNRDTRVRYDRSVDNVRCKFPAQTYLTINFVWLMEFWLNLRESQDEDYREVLSFEKQFRIPLTPRWAINRECLARVHRAFGGTLGRGKGMAASQPSISIQRIISIRFFFVPNNIGTVVVVVVGQAPFAKKSSNRRDVPIFSGTDFRRCFLENLPKAPECRNYFSINVSSTFP